MRPEARRAIRIRRRVTIACAIMCALSLLLAYGLNLQRRQPEDLSEPAMRREAEELARQEEPRNPQPDDAVSPGGDKLASPDGEPDALKIPSDAPADAHPDAEPTDIDSPATDAPPANVRKTASPKPSTTPEPTEGASLLAEDLLRDDAQPTKTGAVPSEAPQDEPSTEEGGEDASFDEGEDDIESAGELRAMGEIVESARPDSSAYRYEHRVVANGKKVSEYAREVPVAMPAGEDYAQVDGILTFRGNNYRDTGAFGLVPDDASGLSIVWTKGIGSIEKWTGVGWTGQASIVRWPEQTRRIMNLNAEKKAKEDLREVIYATLDGNIYFLDLDDGEATRGAIQIPSSVKGSVSVDPRGLPLLYCGQGIPEVNGHSVKIGTRIFSLIDQECLYFLNGRDEFCLRSWYAFDCSPLIDASSDTMLQLGENGIVYTLTLNSKFDSEAGRISIDPVVDRLVYKSAVTTRMGMENSPSVYDHYAYYTDNSGLLTCLDLNTLKPVWLGDVGDDSDSSIVLEEDDEGVWLYTVCELDLNGLKGNVYCRKFNALTGEEIWKIPVPCYRYSKDVDAGGFATPAVGKGSLSQFVYFNVCRVKDGSGALAAVDKQTGEVVWVQSTGAYSWSSPVCVYDSQGRGYIIYGNSNGILRLCDGLTGDEIASVDLGANIEGSPAIFDDMLVVGTRGSKIYGVRITN